MYPFNYPYQYPVYNPSSPIVSQGQSSPRLICKQVGSIDEAKNTIIDPLSIYVFVDFGTGKVYVKRMGDNGQSEFYSYIQESRPLDPMDEIRQRLTSIEARLGGSNDKSIPNAKESATGTSSATGTENEADKS